MKTRDTLAQTSEPPPPTAAGTGRPPLPRPPHLGAVLNVAQHRAVGHVLEEQSCGALVNDGAKELHNVLPRGGLRAPPFFLLARRAEHLDGKEQVSAPSKSMHYLNSVSSNGGGLVPLPQGKAGNARS